MGLKQQISQLMQQSKYSSALKLCEKLCANNKHDPESNYMLASIYGLMGDFSKASEQFKIVVKLQSTALIAHVGLGVSLNELGNFEAAAKAFRDALVLHPDNIDTLIKLAHTLVNMGDLAGSEKCLLRVLDINSVSADALDALGDIRYQSKQYHEAIKYYDQAIKISPKRIDSNTYMGNCLLLLGKSEQAVTYFNKVLSLDGNNLDACIHLGHALKSIGKSQEARQHYQKALTIEPDNIIAVSGMIDLSEKEGAYDKAYEMLLPLVQQHKAGADLASTYVRLCHRFDCCDEAINYALRVLESKDIATQDRANLEYALGRKFDQLGDFDQAFSHYQSANSLSPQTFDSMLHDGFTEALISAFNAPFFVFAPRAIVRSQRPVFIVGMPRSGTSLIEQILASHPLVFGAGELTDISIAVNSLNQLSGKDVQYPHKLNLLDSDLLDKIAANYLEHLGELDTEAARVTDKLPTNFLHLGIIALAFPDAKIIHCTRDPMDTCLSIYFQGFSEENSYANSLKNIGLYYRQYEKLMQHFKSLNNNIAMIDVSYEDLVSNQDEVSKKMIDFIGLEWDEQCLQFHQNDRFVSTPSYDQVRKKMYTSSVGRWKNYEKHLDPLIQALQQK